MSSTAGVCTLLHAIGQQIIELAANVRNAERERADARKNHDKNKLQDLALRIEGLTNRQLVLRRIVDYIYFALLNREVHRYNRFFVHRNSRTSTPMSSGWLWISRKRVTGKAR
jgi:hypothetical protein